MDCANGTTVRQPFPLMHQFGVCDHQDATAEGRKDESHLVPRPHTPHRRQLCCSILDGSVTSTLRTAQTSHRYT